MCVLELSLPNVVRVLIRKQGSKLVKAKTEHQTR